MSVRILGSYFKVGRRGRPRLYILIAAVLLTGCSVYKPAVVEDSFDKAIATDATPYEQMMAAFSHDATNYLKMSREMMAEGDSIAKLIEDTVTTSVDADSLLNVSYSNMLEGDKIERYQKSIEYANEALVAAKQTGERAVEKKIYRQLADVYERLDNKEYADYYKRKSDEIVCTDGARSVSQSTESNATPVETHCRASQITAIAIIALILIAIAIVIIWRRRTAVRLYRRMKSDQQDQPNTVHLTGKTNTFADLNLTSIVYLKTDGNYTTIHYLDENNELTSIEMCQSMSNLLNAMGTQEDFFRCHRSYVVNMRYVTSFDENQVHLTCSPPLPSSKGFIEKYETKKYENCCKSNAMKLASFAETQRSLCKRTIVILALIAISISEISAYKSRKQFEKDYPDHYPGRICLKDGTIKEFPAVRPLFYYDDEVWAWSNVEEFDKVTFDANDVEWVEVWNAKTPERKYRCMKIKKQGLALDYTYMLIDEVNGFRVLNRYYYFKILDDGNLEYLIYDVYDSYSHSTTRVGFPFIFVYNIAKDKVFNPFWGFGYRETDGIVHIGNIRSSLKTVLKDDKALVKELKSVPNDGWTYALMLDFLRRYNCEL